VGLSKPIVLRLKGTNADKAKKMIEGKSKQLGIYYEEDFDTAAQLVTKMVL
jgi:succinyl-CoA synthetase beta subunit